MEQTELDKYIDQTDKLFLKFTDNPYEEHEYDFLKHCLQILYFYKKPTDKYILIPYSLQPEAIFHIDKILSYYI